MGEKTELFPTVPELCAIAREVEKKPLSIPPRPIDGKLVLDENFGIFPREFEDYTYSFLLFEAQKIERRLSSDAISYSQQEPAAPLRFTPEQQMESDLHKFVSAQEQESLDNEEDRLLKSLREKKAPAQPKPDEVSDYERDHLLPRESDDAEEAPLPDDDAVPLPLPPSASSFPQAKPRVLPPKIGQGKSPALPGAPQIPSAKPPAQSAPQIPSAKLSVQPARQAPIAKPAASKPSEQDAYEPTYPVSRQPSSPIMPEMASSAEAGAEKKPPAGISSYSKLSPRLQALIDQKLRREEEKAKATRADSDIFKTPPAPPPEEEHEEEPGKALENVDAPNAWNLHEEEKDAGPDAPAPIGKKTPPSGQDEGEREEIPSEPSGKIQRKMPLRKSDDETAPIPEEEEEQPSLQEEPEAPEPEYEEQEQRAPSTKQPSRKEKSPIAKREIPDEEEETQIPKQIAPEEKEEELPRARSISQSGPFTIKPMFPDAAPSGTLQEKQGISQAEDSDRMRRIQRIIEDLSPDKARAQPRQEEISFEKEDSEDEKEPEEEETKEEEPRMQKEIPMPLKKPASAQKKKASAAQEPVQPKGKQRAAPSKKVQREIPAEEESAEPEEEEGPEEIPIAKKAAPKPPVREEPEEEEIPPPRKFTPRPPIREEESEEKEEAAPVASAPPKMKPRVPREEQKEEEAQAPAKPTRKLMPRIPIRQEEDEKPEEELPSPPKTAVLRRKTAPIGAFGSNRELKPRLPMREEEIEETDEQPAPVSPLRRRILPGMARTAPSTPQTYVPPARERKPISLPPKESEAQGQQEEEAPAPEQEEISPRLAPLKPRKLVSDEAPQESEKTPEQLRQEEKMKKMAEQLARLEAGRIKEVSGTAALPAEEEDIPLPDDDIPKPKDYEQAKESLRKVLEHDETARKVKLEDEVTVEQYAKDHLVWLYEIYKMGGMAREDFLQKASEKYSEAKNAAPASGAEGGNDAPPNPALAALSKEIEKKGKK